MAHLLRGLCRRWARPAQPLRWLSSPAAAPPAAEAAVAALVQPTTATPRQLPKERIFKLLNLKTSAKKVSIVSRLVNVRGLSVHAAVGHLKFMPQKAAVLLRGLLELALRRGPIENRMDPKRMVIGARRAGLTAGRCAQALDLSPPEAPALPSRVRSACCACVCRAPGPFRSPLLLLASADSLWSGRCTYLKRPDFKAKGRMGLIKKPRTTLYARVREVSEAEVAAFKLKLKKGVPDKAAYRRERKAERPPFERAHQKPRVNFWPLS